MGKLRIIKESILSDLESFKAVALSARSLSDLSRHYDLPLNGKQGRWFAATLTRVGLNEDLYNETKHVGSPYPLLIKTCHYCGDMFETRDDGGRRSGRLYCSQTCSNRSRPSHSQESRDKVSATLNQRYAHKAIEKFCECCGNSMGRLMPGLYKRRRFCSLSCRARIMNTTPEARLRVSESQKKAVKEGRHRGWQKHRRGDPSFAERFFMEVLNRRHIDYKREEPCGIYWIDFAIRLSNGTQIALEIDGKQHRRWERQQIDIRKTIHLESQGWNVYRIPWCSINTQTGKDKIQREIDQFEAYYKALAF